MFPRKQTRFTHSKLSNVVLSGPRKRAVHLVEARSPSHSSIGGILSGNDAFPMLVSKWMEGGTVLKYIEQTSGADNLRLVVNCCQLSLLQLL